MCLQESNGFSRLLKLCSAALVLAVASHAAPLYYLATNQTGAQTQIDVNHTSSWLMTPTVLFDFGGGLFTMKSGSATSATVKLELYQGTSSSGTLLASLILSLSNFCAGFSPCSQFASHQFFFTTPITLQPGTTYYAALTSVAPDTQSTAYFIKNNAYFISDQNGNEVIPQPVAFGATAAVVVPETSSALLVSLGILALPLLRKLRKKTD